MLNVVSLDRHNVRQEQLTVFETVNAFVVSEFLKIQEQHK